MFLRMMFVSPETLMLMVKAVGVVHNYLRDCEASLPTVDRLYCPRNMVDNDVNGRIEPGQWRNEDTVVHPVVTQSFGSNMYSQDSARIRNTFMNFMLTAD